MGEVVDVEEGGHWLKGRDEGEEREVREMGTSIVVAGSEESLSFRTEKRPQLNHFEEQVGWNSLLVCVAFSSICMFVFYSTTCSCNCQSFFRKSVVRVCLCVCAQGDKVLEGSPWCSN